METCPKCVRGAIAGGGEGCGARRGRALGGAQRGRQLHGDVVVAAGGAAARAGGGVAAHHHAAAHHLQPAPCAPTRYTLASRPPPRTRSWLIITTRLMQATATATVLGPRLYIEYDKINVVDKNWRE